MLFWFIVFTIFLGLVVFSQAVEHSWEQWHYGRLNRRTLERWRNEQHCRQ